VKRNGQSSCSLGGCRYKWFADLFVALCGVICWNVLNIDSFRRLVKKYVCSHIKLEIYFYKGVKRCRCWSRHCSAWWEVAVSILDGVIGIFHWHNPSSRTGPGVDSTSRRNDYQEYFLRDKGDRCLGQNTYHLHVPIVLKSVSPSRLEQLEPVQACNGIALPFIFVKYMCVLNLEVSWQGWRK